MYQKTANQFEKRIFEDASRLGLFIRKIPEHMQYNPTKKIVYRKKTCFDFFASLDGKALYFDAKSTSQKSFNLTSWLKAYKHQYLSLLEANHKGSVSGLLIWYYNYGAIQWYDIKQVKNAIDLKEKSLKLKESPLTFMDKFVVDFREIVNGPQGERNVCLINRPTSSKL